MIFEAIDERETEARYPDPRPGHFERGERFRREGSDAIAAIETAVQARLWEANKIE